jgi:hypothetical protein
MSSSSTLVPVAETIRPMLPMVEGSLAGVGITAVVQEIATMTGTPRFRILVPAGDADVAREAVAGL